MAFTLAEVLITLAIVGVVAALTIPGLINTITQRAKDAQKTAIENRLLEGFNQLNTLEDGFSAQYETTEDFVKALSKYYKMSAICGADNIGDCWPQKTINNDNHIVNAADLTVSSDLVSINSNQWLPPASFINGQGTPFIMLFKSGCAKDTGRAIREFPSDCVAMLYDQNGTRLPNRVGDDISLYGINKIAQYPLILDDSLGVKIISEVFVPEPITSYTDENGDPMTCAKAKAITYTGSDATTVKNCYNPESQDRWLGAMYYCYTLGGHLATESDLAKMASVIYGTEVSAGGSVLQVGANRNKIPSSVFSSQPGFISSWRNLFSSHELNSQRAYNRIFDFAGTWVYYDPGRDSSAQRAVCVAN